MDKTTLSPVKAMWREERKGQCTQDTRAHAEGVDGCVGGGKGGGRDPAGCLLVRDEKVVVGCGSSSVHRASGGRHGVPHLGGSQGRGGVWMPTSLPARRERLQE